MQLDINKIKEVTTVTRRNKALVYMMRLLLNLSDDDTLIQVFGKSIQNNKKGPFLKNLLVGRLIDKGLIVKNGSVYEYTDYIKELLSDINVIYYLISYGDQDVDRDIRYARYLNKPLVTRSKYGGEERLIDMRNDLQFDNTSLNKAIKPDYVHKVVPKPIKPDKLTRSGFIKMVHDTHTFMEFADLLITDRSAAFAKITKSTKSYFERNKLIKLGSNDEYRFTQELRTLMMDRDIRRYVLWRRYDECCDHIMEFVPINERYTFSNVIKYIEEISKSHDGIFKPADKIVDSYTDDLLDDQWLNSATVSACRTNRKYTIKIDIPDDYMIITGGLIKEGDRRYDFDADCFKPIHENVSVTTYKLVIRKI